MVGWFKQGYSELSVLLSPSSVSGSSLLCRRGFECRSNRRSMVICISRWLHYDHRGPLTLLSWVANPPLCFHFFISLAGDIPRTLKVGGNNPEAVTTIICGTQRQRLVTPAPVHYSKTPKLPYRYGSCTEGSPAKNTVMAPQKQPIMCLFIIGHG